MPRRSTQLLKCVLPAYRVAVRTLVRQATRPRIENEDILWRKLPLSTYLDRTRRSFPSCNESWLSAASKRESLFVRRSIASSKSSQLARVHAMEKPLTPAERGMSTSLAPMDELSSIYRSTPEPENTKWAPLPKDPSERQAAILLRVSNVINAFRHRGHFAAMLDPLRGSSHKKLNPREPIYWGNVEAVDIVRLLKDYPQIDLSIFGLHEVDPNEKLDIADELITTHRRKWTILEVVEFMRGCYCGSTAVEYTHVSDRFQRRWIKSRFESEVPNRDGMDGGFFKGKRLGLLTTEDKIRALNVLIRTDHVERFLGNKFPAVKRFGLEGAEALLPGLHALVERAAEHGVEGVELGMAHRGRLNVLVNLFQKPLGAICNEFTEQDVSVGDVKYHLGTYSKVQFKGRHVHMNLAANPSHLEAVNSVVVGKTRAKQYFVNDTEKTKVMGVLLHGDAAFSGQGIVAEVMELSEIPSYTTGGTIHVIINNMIGFTTDPRASRSSYHCTNVAKGVEAPIFHVNGDDIESVIHVCRLAADWKLKFKKDCVVDIVCYRRHGHNELDEPSLTQPLTYAEIKRHNPVVELYTKELIESGVIEPEMVQNMSNAVLEEFEREYLDSAQYRSTPEQWLVSNWQGQAVSSLVEAGDRPFNLTGVPLETLDDIGHAATTIPANFSAHPAVVKLFQDRQEQLENRMVDMAMAELLAFGVLMLPFTPKDPLFGRIARENADSETRTLADTSDAIKATPELLVQYVEHPTVDVRLSGQDSERGTFNQRHAVIYDQTTAQPYVPLNNLQLGPQATFQVCNSSLSEAAVLGFEYGYSLESDLALTIWEAQFGDFANVAQHIIDNFIASGEQKWGQKSALVLLLPHGYDGQGPEHSSARLERYLQLVDDDPDCVPGMGPHFEEELERAWSVLDQDDDGRVHGDEIAKFLNSIKPMANQNILVGELVGDSSQLTKEEYFMFAAGWMRRNDERTHNLSIVNCTTPANYFHALRRQIHRPYAKPLICMSAKYMLHHRACRSPLEHMGPNTFFRRVIQENGPGDNLIRRRYQLDGPAQIRKVIFCTGKIFYDLYHARGAKKARDITFVRVEQIAPFPFDRLARILARFPNAECLWVQEEPKNMGAYTYVAPRFMTMQKMFLQHKPIRELKYVGRGPSASPATGLFKVHLQETKDIIQEALL